MRKSTRCEYSWCLFRDGITQSALTLWLECREQFYLRYVEGWTGRGESFPLSFGSMFHDLLSKIQGDAGTRDFHISVTRSGISQNKYIRSGVRESKLKTLGIVNVVLEDYYKFWEKADKKRRWLFHEELFTVPCRFDNPFNQTVNFRGRWDGGFTSGGRYPKPGLQEVKTKGQIDEEGLQATLQFDFQSMFYALNFWKGKNKKPANILYDVIRRPQLRQKKTEEWEDYLERIQQDIQDRPAWYYMRWNTKLAKDALQHWSDTVLKGLMENFFVWYQDILTSESRWDCSTHFMNPNALFTKMGGHCDFFDLITRGSKYNLCKRSVPFPELED